MLLNNVISYKSATPQKAPQRFTVGLKKYYLADHADDAFPSWS